MDFTYLRPGKVWTALEGHADRPSLRTVERWCRGAPVPRWAVDAISERLRRKETPEPEWAQGLVRDVGSILEVVESNGNRLLALQVALGATQTEQAPTRDDQAGDPSQLQKDGKGHR